MTENMNTYDRPVQAHAVVSPSEWLRARQELLIQEKAHSRQRDALNAQRRALPWVKVDKTYVFDGPGGRETLSDLFAGHRQLIIHHFMLGPGWTEGCRGCSFNADHAEGALTHLANHGVSYVRVSRAPTVEIQAFNRRMGWHAKWVSSFGSDFNHDYHVTFTPEAIASGRVYYNYGTQPFVCEELAGLSVFYKNEADEIFHTYSTYARGDELALGTYFYLDLTPLGRNENGPNFNLGDWVRHHDRYGTTEAGAPPAGLQSGVIPDP